MTTILLGIGTFEDNISLNLGCCRPPMVFLSYDGVETP